MVDAAGRISRKVADYPAQRLGGGRLDVYAFYPNRFLESHGGWTSRNGKILFFSEDYLNDTFEVDVRISEPRAFRPADYSGATYLPLDKIYDGTQAGTFICSAGAGLKIAMNQNFIVSVELAKCLRPSVLDAGLWLGIGINYQF